MRRIAFVVALTFALFGLVAGPALSKPASTPCRTKSESGRCTEAAQPKAKTQEQQPSRNAAQSPTGDKPALDTGVEALCRPERVQRLSAQQREACRQSGSVLTPAPIDNYQLDNQISGSVGGEVTDAVAGAVAGADKENYLPERVLSDGLGAAWHFYILILSTMLGAIQWALNLDILATSGPTGILDKVQASLGLSGRTFFGLEFRQLAMGILALSFLISMARGRTGTAVKGFVVSLLLMIVVLAIINDPSQTVGVVARGANDVSREAAGTFKETPPGTPASGRNQARYAGVLMDLWNSLATTPWCAANFSDVDWCLGRDRGQRNKRAVSPSDLANQLCNVRDPRKCNAEIAQAAGGGGGGGDLLDNVTDGVGSASPLLGIAIDGAKQGADAVAGSGGCDKVTDWLKTAEKRYRPVDLWLAWPSGKTGVRHCIFQTWNKPDNPNHVHVEAQTAEGFWLVKLPVVGLTLLAAAGAVLLLGLLTVFLLYQAVKAIVLLLLAWPVFFAASLGDHGRDTAWRWLKSLLISLVWVVAAAFGLGICAQVAVTLGGLSTAAGLPWVLSAFLQALFWWAAPFFFIATRLNKRRLLKASSTANAKSGGGQAPGIRDVRDGLARTSNAGKAAAGRLQQLRGIGGAALDQTPLGKSSRDGRTQGMKQTAEQRNRFKAHQNLQRKQAAASEWVTEAKPELDRERRSIDRQLKNYDDKVARASAQNFSMPLPTEEQEALLARRRSLDGVLASSDAREKEELLRAVDRNGGAVPDQLVDREAERRRDLIRSATPTDPAWLNEIGLREDYETAAPAQKAKLAQVAASELAHERTLLAPTEPQATRAESRRALREAEQAIKAPPPARNTPQPPSTPARQDTSLSNGRQGTQTPPPLPDPSAQPALPSPSSGSAAAKQQPESQWREAYRQNAASATRERRQSRPAIRRRHNHHW